MVVAPFAHLTPGFHMAIFSRSFLLCDAQWTKQKSDYSYSIIIAALLFFHQIPHR